MSSCLILVHRQVFGIGEAKNFKFFVLIDTAELWCMRDRLLLKGMYVWSRDLIKFLEMIICKKRCKIES